MAENRLAETQRHFAQAIRENNSKDYDARRLAVYARLVRNNTLGFIDRCFVETPNLLSKQQWQGWKEQFIQKGKAQSPFFQDIAGEFLQFCQENQPLETGILSLMDFEHSQLLAEVAMETIPEEFEWDQDSIMQISPIAYLKQYDVDFLSSSFQELKPEPMTLIIWRNSRFEIYYQPLSELDFWLLNYLQEQPSSLSQLLTELAEITEQQHNFSGILRQTWQKWIDAEVIFPQGLIQYALEH